MIAEGLVLPRARHPEVFHALPPSKTAVVWLAGWRDTPIWFDKLTMSGAAAEFPPLTLSGAAVEFPPLILSLSKDRPGRFGIVTWAG